MPSKPILLTGGVLAAAVAAFLAFGVFGVHTLFVDAEVDEANPFAIETTESVEEPLDDSDDEPADQPEAVEPSADESEPAAASAEPVIQTPVIETIASNNGVLVDHDHQGDGTVNVITDGETTFLRFEDDWDIDNGPDLNVYLARGTDATADASSFVDDFIDLGDLKGNVGAQNYELPEGVDVGDYDTVVIWCVRFGVAFNAADLLS